MNNGKQTKKVFDISRPGKAPASATSRPVITIHKPPIKDPDVTFDYDSQPRQLMDSKKKVKIEPTVAADPKADDKKPAAKAEAPSAPPLPDDKSPKSEETTTEPEEKPAAAPAEVEKPAEPEIPEQALSAETAEQQQRTEEAPEVGRAAINSSVASDFGPSEPSGKNEPLHMDMPESFASTGKVVVSHHGRHRIFWLELLSILLILVLLAAIANFLLDAEIIKTDLDLPHTDFFTGS